MSREMSTSAHNQSRETAVRDNQRRRSRGTGDVTVSGANRRGRDGKIRRRAAFVLAQRGVRSDAWATEKFTTQRRVGQSLQWSVRRQVAGTMSANETGCFSRSRWGKCGCEPLSEGQPIDRYMSRLQTLNAVRRQQPAQSCERTVAGMCFEFYPWTRT